MLCIHTSIWLCVRRRRVSPEKNEIQVEVPLTWDLRKPKGRERRAVSFRIKAIKINSRPPRNMVFVSLSGKLEWIVGSDFKCTCAFVFKALRLFSGQVSGSSTPFSFFSPRSKWTGPSVYNDQNDQTSTPDPKMTQQMLCKRGFSCV